jgi:hypothetical protein
MKLGFARGGSARSDFPVAPQIKLQRVFAVTPARITSEIAAALSYCC